MGPNNSDHNDLNDDYEKDDDDNDDDGFDPTERAEVGSGILLTTGEKKKEKMAEIETTAS